MSSRRRLFIGSIVLFCVSIVLLRYDLDTNGGRLVLPLSSHSLTSTADQSNSTASLPEIEVEGTPKFPVDETEFSIQLVVGRTSLQNTTWLSEEVSSTPAVTYIADDLTASHHTPINKGNEVMIYLTYIIEHYDTLPDISLFIHPHRYAWHNNDLLDNDMAEMLRHLKMGRVMQEGYVNLRCQWGPGCPHWLRPQDGALGAKMSKQEQIQISKVWRELFPLQPLPVGLSGPCCAQFAVTKDTIRRHPVQWYVTLRNWVMETELSDYIVGRCFEYLWQYIFTGREEVCPDQHICYCEGYGLCFESDAAFQKWFEIRQKAIKKQQELDTPTDHINEDAERLRSEIETMQIDLAERKNAAFARGMAATHPRNG
jgi:hypothetical protein